MMIFVCIAGSFLEEISRTIVFFWLIAMPCVCIVCTVIAIHFTVYLLFYACLQTKHWKICEQNFIRCAHKPPTNVRCVPGLENSIQTRVADVAD